MRTCKICQVKFLPEEMVGDECINCSGVLLYDALEDHHHLDEDFFQ